MAVRPIDGTWSKFVWNLSKSESLARKFRDGKACLIDLRLAVEDQPTLTPPNEWVSVEERLPTDEHPVLVFLGYADTMTGFITTSSYFCFDENPHWQWDGLVRDEQRTLFWMPLPAPPDRRPPEGEADEWK